MKALVRLLSLLAFGLVLYSMPSTGFAADKVYTEGPVWQISYIRTTPGMFDKYMDNLNHMWKVQMDAAIKKGYVVSYQVLSKDPATPKDWDLMLMVEFKNMAAFDGLSDKMDALAKETMNETPDTMSEKTVKRGALREILGTVYTRQLMFK